MTQIETGGHSPDKPRENLSAPDLEGDQFFSVDEVNRLVNNLGSKLDIKQLSSEDRRKVAVTLIRMIDELKGESSN